MRATRTVLLCLLVALTAGSADGTFAKKISGRGPSPDIGQADGRRWWARARRGRDQALQLCQPIASRGAAAQVRNGPPGKPDVPAIQFDALSLAHPGPPLRDKRRARSRRRPARSLGAAELSLRSAEQVTRIHLRSQPGAANCNDDQPVDTNDDRRSASNNETACNAQRHDR